MPTPFHEDLKSKLRKRVERWVDDLQCPFDTVGGKIREMGSTNIRVGGGSTKEPDSSFAYESDSAGLVIEVSWSEEPADAAEKAKKYIEGTRGRTRTVIYVDGNSFSEGQSEVARFSIWRAEINEIDRVRSVRVDASNTNKVIKLSFRKSNCFNRICRFFEIRMVNRSLELTYASR